MLINTLDDYQVLASRTSKAGQQQQDRITNAALGAAGEAGELANKWKKMLFHGHEFDRDALIDEMGDVLWYLAEMSSAVGVNFTEVAQRNVEKLTRRYPEGFSEQCSINRED